MKYTLGEEKEVDGIKMRRVVALVAIASKGVAVGDVGGWVESEANLSQSSDEAQVSGKALVSEARHLLVICPVGSRNACVTFADNYAATGCFCGTWEQFSEHVIRTHGDSAHAREYLAALEFAKVRFGGAK